MDVVCMTWIALIVKNFEELFLRCYLKHPSYLNYLSIKSDHILTQKTKKSFSIKYKKENLK